MGRSLGLRVIAEGVETQDQLEFLKAHHCDEAQGYLFSRPVPPQQFAKLIESQFDFGDAPVEAVWATSFEGIRGPKGLALT